MTANSVSSLFLFNFHAPTHWVLHPDVPPNLPAALALNCWMLQKTEIATWAIWQHWKHCPAINKALMCLCLTAPLTLGPAASSPFPGEAALILDHFVIFKTKNLILQPFLKTQNGISFKNVKSGTTRNLEDEGKNYLKMSKRKQL